MSLVSGRKRNQLPSYIILLYNLNSISPLKESIKKKTCETHIYEALENFPTYLNTHQIQIPLDENLEILQGVKLEEV